MKSTNTHQKKIEENQAYKNPSYDMTLPFKRRFRDFLGAYHVILNGVVAHNPYTLENEGQPGVMCDEDDKKRMVEYVENQLTLLFKEIEEKNLQFLEECEPDCDDVRHARHQGSWDHYWNMGKALKSLEERYLGIKEEQTQ